MFRVNCIMLSVKYKVCSKNAACTSTSSKLGKGVECEVHKKLDLFIGTNNNIAMDTIETYAEEIK